MSAIPSSLPPSPTPSARADLAVPAAAGGRSPAATRLETARAVLPVEAARGPADIRFTVQDRRPVGPAPAFQVSLLQARQASAMQLPPLHPPIMAEGEPSIAPARPDVEPGIDRKI